LLAVALPKAKDKPEGALPPLSRAVMITLVVYFIAFTLSSKSIVVNAYSDAQRTLFWVPLGGVIAFGEGLVLYEIYRRARVGSLNSWRALALLFVFLLITDYSKGSTGSATGFAFTAAFLILGRTGRPWVRPLKIFGVLAGAVVLALLVRQTRSTLYAEGSDAVAAASENLASAEERRASTASGIEGSTNGSQNAAHVLECALLYNAGYSREWRSLYLPILYTFQPQFIMELLGRERQMDAPWELAEYFIHGGGLAIFGEMYWNGGYACVVLISALVLLIAYFADTRSHRSFGWVIFHCMYVPILFPGMGYGLNYLFRGASNALLAFVAYKLFARVRTLSTRTLPGPTTERGPRTWRAA